MMSSTQRTYILRVLGAGWLLAVFTGLYNIGFLALDDYNKEIMGMIPAQTQLPIGQWVHDELYPPYARLFLEMISRGWLALGVQAPIWQLRLSLMLLAAASFAISAWVFVQLFAKASFRTNRWAAFLLGFYFLSPLIFSRPMVESLSIPFLLMSAWLATSYLTTSRFRDLALSLVVLAIGCMIRCQIGVVVPVIFALPLLRRRYLHVGLLFALGVACIVISGMADIATGLKFHESIYRYVSYNEFAGERHGVMPFYNFVLLLVGLSFPPVFFSRFRNMKWKAEYQPLMVVLWFFILFVLGHSASPHKEERFMIPIIPFFIALLAPMLAHLSAEGARWRVAYFHIVNAILLALVVTQVPQRNTIDLVLAIDRRPNIVSLATLEDSLALFPSSYGLRARTVPTRGVSMNDVANTQNWSCGEPLVVRFDKSESFATVPKQEKFIKVAEFPPGLIERVLVRTNPSRNIRRGKLELWWPEKCGSF